MEKSDGKIQRCELTVKGRVQGVGYRYFVLHEARRLNIRGIVRNLQNGNVLVHAEGEQMGEFISSLRRGPVFAAVTEVEVEDLAERYHYEGFRVL